MDEVLKSLDIILVSYNSEKWIENCLRSLENISYDLKNIFITFVDNNSSDRTQELIKDYSNKSVFGGYQYFFETRNLGFGKANNLGVNHSNQDYIYFLNIDTELDHNAIQALMNAVDQSPEQAALWESRQFPYEHPKVYDPVSLEVTWASGACMMVRRDRFIEVGLFDEKIFMYGEDVDLSWRFRAFGYSLHYTPSSIVYHYTYMSAGEVKPNQFYNSTYMNLMLRYKFGTLRDIAKGYALYSSLMMVRGPSEGHKKIIFKRLFRSTIEGMKFRVWKSRNKHRDFHADFKLWDYEIIREGAFYVNEKPSQSPLVSILIRTHNRPNVLREALISVRNQTYRNIEVVVIEDGAPTAKAMIEQEFKDLNIVYVSTGENVGRCLAGNLALKTATGEYFNFLDDDDVLYADHVESLLTQILNNPSYKAAYSISFEVPTMVLSTEPYEYKELFHNVQHKQPFNRLVLLHHNYFPIQTVLFSRDLYEEFGGFDPELEVLEDWDLWLRYALKYEFLFVEKLTSIYRIPATINHSNTRQKLFDDYLFIVREKHLNQKFEISAASIFKDAEYLMNKPAIVIPYVRKMPFKTFVFKAKNKAVYMVKKVLK